MKKIDYVKLHLIIFFISAIFQNISLVDFGSFSLKPFHVLSLSFIPYLIKKKLVFLPPYINIAYIFGVLLSMIMYLKYGFNSLIFNYLFGYYLAFVLINILPKYSKKEIIKLLQFFAIFAFIIISFNVFLQRDAIIYYMLNPYGGHPYMTTIIAGGVNIEATWLVIFSILFLKNDFMKFLMLIWSTIISILYGSRTAIIGCAFVFFLICIDSIKFRKKNSVIALSLIIIFFIIYGITNDFVELLLNRFLNIGTDNGSVGRMNMWSNVNLAFVKNPFGYGCGNAINGISFVANREFTESNLHNIYLQFLLDFGIIGFIYILVLVSRFIFEIKNRLNELTFIVMLYLLMGLFEFRGGDILFFIMLGGYYVLDNVKGEEYDGQRIYEVCHE